MAGEFTYTPVEASPYLKHVVNVCQWSPKTDLIAIGTHSGTVSVHRYKMTCVWESAQPSLGKVTALAWQPDGKSLAVAHHSGAVRFYLTNDGFLYNELQLSGCIHHLSWSGVHLGLLQYRDQLRNLSLHCSAIRMCKSLTDSSSAIVGVMALLTGITTLAVGGLEFRSNLRILGGYDSGNGLQIYYICSSALREQHELVSVRGTRRIHLVWQLPDWTAQTLKRTGTATLKAYESIKTICFEQLQLLIQRLIFHTSELLGNLRDKQRYSRFRIPSEAVVKLINTSATVLQKTQELYIVIEMSVTHLRAFFKWLYVAIHSQSGRVLSDDLTRITTSERELVIDFATNYLQPIFADGELQSYQVDLVQQYIQSGEVRKPLTEVAEHSLTKDKERAGLRKLIQFSEEDTLNNEIPVGCFQYCPKITLCDLIKKNLQNDIDQLFRLETENHFSRGCLNLDQVTSYRLFCGQVSSRCAFDSTLLPTHACLGVNRSAFQSLGSEADKEQQTIVAWNPPTHPLTSPTGDPVPDGLLLFRPDTPPGGHSSSSLRGVHLQVDNIPCSAHPDGLPIFLQSFHFYSPELLLLLVNEMVQPGATRFPAPPRSWWVTVPLASISQSLDHPESLVQTASQPLWSAEQSPPTPVPTVRLSSLISTANVEALPWFTVKSAVNGERSIVLALFKGQNTCRVYLVERLEEAAMESDALLTT